MSMTHICPHLMGGNFHEEDEGSTGYDQAFSNAIDNVPASIFNVLLSKSLSKPKKGVYISDC